MQVITSKENELIKNIKKLKEKKYRDEKQEYIIEGIKMIKEAIEENKKIIYIVVCEESNINEFNEYKKIIVSKKVFMQLTDVSNPQGILAVIEKDKKCDIKYDEDIILILDGIQDPGNLGTILRIADSVGLKQVIVSNKTVECYNPKVVRSTMGAMFRVNVIQSEELLETVKDLKEKGFGIVATSLKTEKSIYNINYNKKAIIIGNEANGVSEKLIENADEKVKIPMLGKAESLNAGVATGIILYEYVRNKLK